MLSKKIALILFAVAGLLMGACSNKKEEKKDGKIPQPTIDSSDAEVAIPGIDSWIGKYEYNEKPVESNGGYNMVMGWSLTISKQNDSLQGNLEINGQQTFIKMITNILGDGKSISVTYNRMVDGMDQDLSKNVVLFSITKKNNTMETSFDAMEPRLTENPQKICECFLPAR
jgi:hypothetical protein